MVALTLRQSQPFNDLLNVTTMRKYLKPELYMLDIVAERGYGDSVGLPGFGTENDELIY